MVEVHGSCDERFHLLHDLLQAHLDSGVDEGASFALNVGGDCVVDLWGGYRDLAHTEPWERDTLVRVFSTSKAVVAIATLVLWDRGLIDLDAPIATYWPEFAQNGKATITTRHVLVHTSGLPGFGCAPSGADLRDWDHMIDIVERAPAWYEPGTISCYHPITFGYILGELVHRVTALSFSQFVSEEITAPLGADFHFSLNAPSDVARVSELRPVPTPWAAMSGMGTRVQAEMGEVIESLLSTELLDGDDYFLRQVEQWQALIDSLANLG